MTCTRRLKNPDGHTLWAEITLTPTAHDGEALLSVADISERARSARAVCAISRCTTR